MMYVDHTAAKEIEKEEVENTSKTWERPCPKWRTWWGFIF